jgi:hypothetical protein
MLKKLMYGAVTLSVLAVIQGCSTGRMGIEHSQPINIASNSRIAVVPFYNTTNHARAGVKAAIITASLLRSENRDVVGIPYFDHNKHHAYKSMLMRCAWARNHNISYVMKGIVNEWGYIATTKGNLPVASISLQLRETTNCNIVWNAVGNKTGYPQTSVSGVAQGLISHMLHSMNSKRSFYY